jgi:hypothetical protein
MCNWDLELFGAKRLERQRRATIRRSIPPEVLQRPLWNGQPVELGHLFRLHRRRGDKRLDAICRLMSHQFGWEVVLDVNDELQRSQVCRSQDEVLTTGEQWRAAMTKNGWQ